MKKRIVIALGGNALGENNQEQIQAVKVATGHIVKLIKEGHDIVILHGNGPQVGKIQLAFAAGSTIDKNVETMPLPEAIAMSQGYIGHHIQNALINELRSQNISKSVATIVTHALVDVEDPSLKKPSKPIGPFYSLETIKEKGFSDYIEDAGRGYRQVVASPLPKAFLEVESVRALMAANTVVICSGGGSVPVIEKNNQYIPIDAVIDKDAAGALLAQNIEADLFLILTAVDNVSLHYKKENQQVLESVAVAELETYIGEGHFAPGSMLPKVEAALRFVKLNPQGVSIITSLEKAQLALEGKAGTRIIA